MSTPRSGFRRAAATSWTLAGLGIAGVAGASALAYADTVKPAEALVPADAVELPAVPDAAPVMTIPLPWSAASAGPPATGSSWSWRWGSPSSGSSSGAPRW